MRVAPGAAEPSEARARERSALSPAGTVSRAIPRSGAQVACPPCDAATALTARHTVPARDAFELALTRGALERELPLLGVCRGMQVLNVALGGTLIQHLPDAVGHDGHRRSLGTFQGNDHDVRLVPGSLAARAAGEERHPTKSHHHQAVDCLGSGLVVTGHAVEDELPEAVELPGRWVLGVQWHPEVDPASPLIAALVEEARTYRAERAGHREAA